MSSNKDTFILPERIRPRDPPADTEHQEATAVLSKKLKRDMAEDIPALPAGTLQCPDCPLSFSCSGNLRKHMLDFHQKRLPAGKAGRPSTGGKAAANKRAYEKLKAKTKKATIVKSDLQIKKSQYNAKRYQMKKAAKEREMLERHAATEASDLDETIEFRLSNNDIIHDTPSTSVEQQPRAVQNNTIDFTDHMALIRAFEENPRALDDQELSTLACATRIIENILQPNDNSH